MIQHTLSIFFLFQLLSSRDALAQVNCDGSNIAQASALTGYPPTFTIAQIQPGDTAAQTLFNAIQNSGAAALAFPPFALANGAPQVGAYNAGTDPACAWTWSNCKTPKAPGIPPDFYICQEPSVWGLSIDDGPTCYHNQLYNYMQQNNQLASLYYIGTNIIQWPAEAQKGYLNGHEICVHTWSHHYMTTLTNEQVFAELYYTKKIIKQVTGASVRCWRPPYGDVDDRVRTIAAALDLHTHIWAHDTNDWSMDSGTPASTIAGNYQTIINTDHSQQGFVVLTHEISQATCDMLQQELPQIAHSFQNTMPVSTCNNDTVIFGEAALPTFPGYSAYASGQRGGSRSNNGFWNSGNMNFLGNGTAAQLYGQPAVSSAAPPSSTSTSQPSKAGTSASQTLNPSNVINAKQGLSSSACQSAVTSLVAISCISVALIILS